MNLRTKSQKGFTIVELLIVIVVIAILAAISIVAFTGVQQRARDTARAADAKTLADALSSFNASEGFWPGNASGASVTTATLQAALRSYQTVKVPEEVIAKTSVNTAVATATPTPTAPTSANANNITVYFTGSLTAPTGAYILYGKENGGWAWLNYKVGAAS